MLKDIKAIFVSTPPKIKSEKDFEIDANCKIKSWQKEFSLKDFDQALSLINIDGINDALIHLNGIIDFCKEHDAKPIVVLPPVYHSLSDKIGESAKTKFVDVLMSKLKERKIDCYDYFIHKDFC